MIGTVAGVASLIVAVAAWQWPRSPAEPKPGGASASAASASAKGANAGESGAGGSTASPATRPPTTGGATASRFLADTDPESGAAYLRQLPRAIRGDAAYNSRPMVVACPSNQSGDQRHDVTYQLHGRYADFAAQVHPYYPEGTDQAAVAIVTLVTEVRQSDGSLVKSDAVELGTATPGEPKALAAAIDGAEKVTVRVQCDNPGGLVALTDARVS